MLTSSVLMNIPLSTTKHALCLFRGKSFKASTELTKHYQCHSDERPYDHCDMQFKTLYGKQKHLVIHSEEKPFQCSLCQKVCRNSHQLEAHQRMHSDESPFSCSLCEKSLKSKFQCCLHPTQISLSPSTATPFLKTRHFHFSSAVLDLLYSGF